MCEKLPFLKVITRDFINRAIEGGDQCHIIKEALS